MAPSDEKTPAPAPAAKSSNPPPGVSDGGIWGKHKYIGAMTCVGCLFVGCLIFCCPCDEKDAYKVDGKIYDAGGELLGPAGSTSFIPVRS